MTDTPTAKSIKLAKRRDFRDRLNYLERSFIILNRVTKMVTSSRRGSVTIDGEEFTPETVKDMQAAFRSQLKGLNELFVAYGKKNSSSRSKTKKPPKLCLISDHFASFLDGERGKFPDEIEALRGGALDAVIKGRVASQGVIMSLLNHYITCHLKGEDKRWRDDGTLAKYFPDTKMFLKGVDYTPTDFAEDASLPLLERLEKTCGNNYSKNYDVTVKEDGKKVKKTVNDDVFSGTNRLVTSMCNMFKVKEEFVDPERGRKLLNRLKDRKYIDAISVVLKATTEATRRRKEEESASVEE